MRYLILSFALLLTSPLVFSQQLTSSVVKVHPFNLLLDSYFTLGIEKKVTPGLAFEFNFKWKREESIAMEMYDTTTFYFRSGEGVQFDGMVRWYPNKVALKGLYLGVMERYRQFSTKPFNFFENVPVGEEDFYYKIVHRRKQISTMLIGGYQFVFSNNLVIDLTCGVGHTYRWVDEKLVDLYVSTSHLPGRVWKYKGNAPAFYFGCALGYMF